MAKSNLKAEAFVKWFRTATPYIHQWGGATFVIAFGGEVLADGEFQQLTHDINVLVSLEVRVVLVHDGGPAEHCLVVAVAPVRLFGENSAEHLRVVIRDETDRHETEQIRKDFVANASHELRTPLSIINGYLENLLDGVIDDPAMARKSLQTMQKHGERIARIVEDMLTLSKFESAGEKGTASTSLG